ncbi:MAG: helix-turn-helix transcriptional regulator [Acidimicrobiales bacterium]
MVAPTTKKLSRLLNLLAALTETARPLTAKELRERVDADWGDSDDAFRRAFERDKFELRQLGIEISLADIPGADPPEHGYWLPRDQYALRDPGLEPDEAAALHLAASLVRLEGVEGSGAMWKLGGPTGSEGGGGVAALPRHPQLGPLFGAVAERRTVSFAYRGERRRVDPYRLDFERGRWYLSGRDHDRGETRLFRIDRMEGEPDVGPVGAFARPAETVPRSSTDPWSLGEGEPLVARVRVDAVQAAVARTTLGDAAVVEEDADGSIVVELPVTHVDGFRSFVLGFLDHAEVLSPPGLRSAVVDWLRGVAD